MPLTIKERQDRFRLKKKDKGLIQCCDIWATSERKKQFKAIAVLDEERIKDGYETKENK